MAMWWRFAQPAVTRAATNTAATAHRAIERVVMRTVYAAGAPTSRERQLDRDHGPLAGRARDRERTPRLLYELARQVEPEPGALCARGEEWFTESREDGCGNARAGVGDAHPQPPGARFAAHPHGTAGGNRLERVLEQVQ